MEYVTTVIIISKDNYYVGEERSAVGVEEADSIEISCSQGISMES